METTVKQTLSQNLATEFQKLDAAQSNVANGSMLEMYELVMVGIIMHTNTTLSWSNQILWPGPRYNINLINSYVLPIFLSEKTSNDIAFKKPNQFIWFDFGTPKFRTF